MDPGDTDGSALDPMIGRVIAARYRIEERLGSGAMGLVYRARHIKIGRAFAVKVLHLELLSNDKLRRRFVREAELAGTLNHRNVVGVVDVGETPEGLHYIVMELAEGPTLGTIMAEGPLPIPRLVELVRQLCDGLHHAHERGLIHRDFKPDNVIVERDRTGHELARVLDFGIAIVRDNASSAERERLTTAGIVLGTPHYMAPEHVTGQAIDHRIDLFALGVVVYEMLTGKMPFDGDGVDVARANLLEDPPAMAERAPGVPIDPLLEAFTRRLLSKAPDHRPATAAAARALLDLILSDPTAAAAQLGLTGAPARTSVARAPTAFRSHAHFTPPTPFPALVEHLPRPSAPYPIPIAPSPSGRLAVPRNLPRISTAPILLDEPNPPPPAAPPSRMARASTDPRALVAARRRRLWIAVAAGVAAIALGAALALLLA